MYFYKNTCLVALASELVVEHLVPGELVRCTRQRASMGSGATGPSCRRPTQSGVLKKDDGKDIHR